MTNFAHSSDFYRYFIELAYDGSSFCGWQNQPNGISVQQTIEEALSTVLRSNVSIVGCGRTDTGVHATQFFAHFDWATEVEEVISLEKLTHKLNSMLPKSIVIYRIFPVSQSLHARFSATERSYRYYIAKQKNPFTHHHSTRSFVPLNLDLLNEASQYLIGHQDFQCFSKVKTGVNNFLCTVTRAEWREEGEMLIFEISANRFLRNMVRAIVGTLLEIGNGSTPPCEMVNVLNGRDRCLAGKSVAAKGLFLTEVKYIDL